MGETLPTINRQRSLMCAKQERRSTLHGPWVAFRRLGRQFLPTPASRVVAHCSRASCPWPWGRNPTHPALLPRCGQCLGSSAWPHHMLVKRSSLTSGPLFWAEEDAVRGEWIAGVLQGCKGQEVACE